MRDDGVGFDPALAEHGFGLVAMRQRIAALSGTLQVESEPGGGTAISACVPTVPALAARERRWLAADQAADRGRPSRWCATGSAACSPPTRTSPWSARRATARRRCGSRKPCRPDVILMDLRMPGMDGVTAIAELARRGNPARVLVLTTYDTDSYVLPAIEAGATGYLLKDAPRDELLRAVRAAAAGQSVLAPSVATRLMSRVREPEPEVLSQRELEVLGLVAAGHHQQGDGGAAVHQRGHREDAPAAHLRQARRHRPRRRRCRGLQPRAADPGEAGSSALLGNLDGRLGLGADLFLVDARGELDEHEPVRGDVEDAEVGDDPLDHALARCRAGSTRRRSCSCRPWRRAPSAR